MRAYKARVPYNGPVGGGMLYMMAGHGALGGGVDEQIHGRAGISSSLKCQWREQVT